MKPTFSTPLNLEQHSLVCAIRPDGRRDDLFWERVAYDLNWSQLYNLAVHHNVLALVQRSLRGLRLLGLDPRGLQHFKQAALIHALRNERLAGRLLDVLDLFALLDVQALPFKGPALAQQAYGDLGLRQFLDLDLLIRRSDFERAARALIQAGWRPEMDLPAPQLKWHLRSAYHLRFERQGDLLELHWGIGERSHVCPLPEQFFWKSTHTINLLERPLQTLSLANSLLAVCIHGASNQWQKLKWIADVAWLVQSHPDLDLQGLMGEARRLGFQRVLLCGLSLAEQFAGLDGLPAGIQDQMHRDRQVQELTAHVCTTSIAAITNLGALPNNLFYLRSRERLRERLYYVYDQGFVPKYADWTALPLPSWLYPLYFLFRPVRVLFKFAPQLFMTAATRAYPSRADGD